MKVWLTLFLAFMIGAAAWAQGIPCDSSFCVCLTDNSCSTTCCTGCNTTTFTVPCELAYAVAAAVLCSYPPDKCKYCMVCVRIYPTGDPGHALYNWHNADCSNEHCSFSGSVMLKPHTSYTLEVCLSACPFPNDCSMCGPTCTAWACISHRTIIPCGPF